MKNRIISLTAFFFLFLGSYTLGFAAILPVQNFLPGSTQPGVMSNYLSQKAHHGLLPLPPRRPILPEQPSFGPEAGVVSFKLTKIIIEGNHVYTQQQLFPLYKDQLNTNITVAKLAALVQSITNFYHNNGYILSEAYLPPQRIHNGVVQIKIIEGYVDKVTIVGNPKKARKILEIYGAKIEQSKPLQEKVLERYMLLANEIPGMTAKAVLEPSKKVVGTTNLTITAEEKSYSAYYSYDNYGSLFLGPQENSLGGTLNSILLPGDQASVSLEETTRPKQLRYYDVHYQSLIGKDGMYANIGKNYSTTRPGLNLTALKVNGQSVTYYSNVYYSVLRTREASFILDAGFNYIDSQVTITPATLLLYRDHLRPIDVGGTYDFINHANGSASIGLHYTQGLNIFGASNSPISTTTSRFAADGVFSKFNLQVMYQQPFAKKFEFYILATGQYAFNPLLVSTQYAYGGYLMGRGYDPAEIIGDSGLGEAGELRMNLQPNIPLVQSMQAYIFYDAGAIWNIKNLPEVKKKQSITSTGFGARFTFTKFVTANVMFGQPLTKQIFAESLRGRGRCPRVQFSIMASI